MICKLFSIFALCAMLCATTSTWRAEGEEIAKESDSAVGVAGAFIRNAPLSPEEQKDVLEGIKSYPNQREWVMSGDGNVYSIVLRPIQKDSRQNVQTKLEDMAKNAAALRVKYLLYLRAVSPNRKGAYGHEDSLADALVAWDESSGGSRITLKRSVTTSSGDWAFSLAVAPDDSFVALTKRVESIDARALDTVYCEVLYPRAKAMLAEKRYEDALPFYGELLSMKWARPEVSLEAAECYANTGRRGEAAKVVAEALNEFGGDMESELLEYAGDLLFELGDESGAERVYKLAADKMRGER
jgi:tetratricopeptide (TPR) repeat protein